MIASLLLETNNLGYKERINSVITRIKYNSTEERIDSVLTQEKFNSTEERKGTNPVLTQEKYLTYLPHSGLHNQRIAFENAIFLAWALNRTLILPPLILGDRTRYRYDYNLKSNQFENLESKLSNLSQIKHENCKNIKNKQELLKCERIRDSYTFYRWDALFDLTFILKNIKMIYREDLNPENLFSKFNISKERVWKTEGCFRDNLIRDTGGHKYDRYHKRFNIIELSERNEELFYFNSLFGSGYIRLALPKNIQFMKKIKNSMILSQNILLDITKKISNELGGQKKYLGVHARVGDAQYLKSSQKNVKKLISDIKKSRLLNITECKQDDPTKSSKIIYLASDVTSKSEILKPIFKEFPCTLMLENFKDLLNPMDKLINERDGIKLKNHLIPLLDLMIAAHGNHVFTIKGSTSASYLRRYHNIL